jgi:hypothetical protein
MNYRRGLRISTDTGLMIFALMIVGVVLWTTDEVLNWNILPDWIDKYAQLIVIVLSILAGFAVVISVMCSFAVLAESAAEKAGIASPMASPQRRRWVIGAILAALVLMFGLHKVDQYRARQREKAEEAERRARFAEVQQELERQVPGIIALFSPELRAQLAAFARSGGDGAIGRLLNAEGDAAVARLLNAIQLSTPFRPEVRVLVGSAEPYKYCVLSALPEAESEKTAKFLKRQFLTALPTKWERDAIEAMFTNRPATVPKNTEGTVIDTRKPSAWGSVTNNTNVVAVVMLQSHAQ